MKAQTLFYNIISGNLPPSLEKDFIKGRKNTYTFKTRLSRSVKKRNRKVTLSNVNFLNK